MKPDILILMPDQFRYDCIGATGNKIIKTPNIDRIVKDGVVFTKTYTVSPLCMPARASFVSGLYPHSHNIWENKGELPENDETIFHHLQNAGYYVAYIGKSHFYEHRHFHMKEREDYMRKRGINYVHETTGPHATVTTDSYLSDYLKGKGVLQIFRNDYKNRNKFSTHPSPLSEEDYLDSYVGRKSVEFIENYDKKQPLCLFVGFPGPHEPWDPPGRFARMYNPEDMPEEIKDREDFMEGLPEKIRKRMEMERKTGEGINSDIIKKIRAMYYGKISLIDYWIGEILNAFMRKRDYDNLIIIFWSDHGEMLGDHGMLYKSVFYESSVRVPLIIRWKEKQEDLLINKEKNIEIIDVFQTLLYGLGISLSERAYGKNLFNEIQDDTVLSEIYAFGTYNFMVRYKNYKYVITREGEEIYLFDLEKDPYETQNLVIESEYEEVKEIVKKQLLKKLLFSQWKK